MSLAMFVSGKSTEKNPRETSVLKLLDSAPMIAPLIQTDYGLPSWVGEIRPEEFREIRDLSFRIISRYSVEDSLFVGIGRSPTPIIGYLQESQKAHAMNLPLSRFRHRPQGRSVEIDQTKLERYQPLNAEALKTLYQHFDRFFLLETEVWRRKRWILIDFSRSGDTLVSAFDYLSAYLRHRKPRTRTPELQTLCLVDSIHNLQKIKITLGRRPTQILEVVSYPNLCGGLAMQRYDLASEFGTFFVEKAEHSLLKNKSYKRLRASIRNEMNWQELQSHAKHFSELQARTFESHYITPCLKNENVKADNLKPNAT